MRGGQAGQLLNQVITWSAGLWSSARSWWRAASRGRRVVVLVVVLAGVFGAAAATAELGARFTLPVLVFAALMLLEPFRWWVGAAVVGLLAMVGFSLSLNLVFGVLGVDSRLPLWIGVLIGFGAFALAAFVVLTFRFRRRWSAVAALLLAAAVVIGAPWWVGSEARKEVRVQAAQDIPAKVDVVIVSPPAGEGLPGALAEVPGDLSLNYSVFRVGDGGPELVLDASADVDQIGPVLAGTTAVDGSEAPERLPLRDGSDVVILLNVDAAPAVWSDPASVSSVDAEPGELRRWRQLLGELELPRLPADDARLAKAPVFALLRSTDAKRLKAWREWLGDGRRGGVYPISWLDAEGLATAGREVAVESPSANQDLLLAEQFRPLLLFDDEETDSRPLDIDALFGAGRIALCEENTLVESCPTVTDPRELRMGAHHLNIDAEDAESLASSIYVHPSPDPAAPKKRLLLDYWWYLAQNPAESIGGASCRAGLFLPSITCFDHQSDWEGVTVVVDRSGAEPEPVAVQYAQHSKVVRYDWAALEDRWSGDRYDDWRRQAGSERPLVFVANGTHAGYPVYCESGCEQEAEELGENQHRGGIEWESNGENCLEQGCLKPLPTLARGERPALWNAFGEPWGERNCIFTHICDTTDPPGAPGTQKRYLRPEAADETIQAGKEPG